MTKYGWPQKTQPISLGNPDHLNQGIFQLSSVRLYNDTGPNHDFYFPKIVAQPGDTIELKITLKV